MDLDLLGIGHLISFWAFIFVLQAGLLSLVMYAVRSGSKSPHFCAAYDGSLPPWLVGVACYSALTAAPTGCTQLITLSDLENDFINPHDCAKRVNRLVVRTLQLSSAAWL